MDEILLGKAEYMEIAELLPKYPPLSSDGDVSIKDMYPDLLDDELDEVYKLYKEIGGTMDKE